jgi:ABC-type transport system involved in cytochrome c biogenesis permease subunit
MVMEMFGNAGIFGKLGVLVSLAAVGMALIYAIKPNEQRLALMRPLSLAAIFGGLSSFTIGVVSILQGISETPTFTVNTWHHIAAGAAEAVIALFVVFGCLTIAWLLVTVGLRRA